MSQQAVEPGSASRSRTSLVRSFARRTICASLVSAAVLGIIVFIKCIFAGMPDGMMLLALKASGIGGLSGLVASVAFSLFRRLNRFGAVLSGFVTIAAYMSSFSVLFRGSADTSVMFWVFNAIYGIAIGLIIFWPIQQLSLRGRESQALAEEGVSRDANEHD